MSEEDALLNAIAAHPDEDTPRLIYADWLDEHAEHLREPDLARVRAEFIRVQIEISQKEDLPRAMQDCYVALYKRNQELLDNHRAALLGPLTEISVEKEIQFRRGFAESVELTVPQLMMVGEMIAGLRPVPEIILWDAAYSLGRLPEISHLLNYVAVLHLSGTGWDSPPSLTPANVWNVFVERWTWNRLKEIDLSECRIGDEGMARLVESENLSLLTILDVSDNNLTAAAFDSLLNSKLPTQLKRLILSGNSITDAGAIELASRWPTGNADRLMYLGLRFTQIGRASQRALLSRFGARVEL